jgi:predicted lysophospholipase L1 biosynthesis ABC-type transport system permease subunit
LCRSRADQVATIRPTLLLLQAGVLALLASERSKELAVRQALGASRRHVVTEAAVEATLLTLTGGLLALAVGADGIRLVAALFWAACSQRQSPLDRVHCAARESFGGFSRPIR